MVFHKSKIFQRGLENIKNVLLGKTPENLVSSVVPFGAGGSQALRSVPRIAPVVGKVVRTVGKVAKGVGKTFFGTVKRALATTTGVGILQTSPTARTFVTERLKSPTGVGKAIGETIEKTREKFFFNRPDLQTLASPSDLGFPVSPSGIKDTLKGGVIGAGVGLLGAGLVAGRTAISRARQQPIPSFQVPPVLLPTAIESQTIPGAVAPTPTTKRTTTRKKAPQIVNIIQNQVSVS